MGFNRIGTFVLGLALVGFMGCGEAEKRAPLNETQKSMVKEFANAMASTESAVRNAKYQARAKQAKTATTAEVEGGIELDRVSRMAKRIDDAKCEILDKDQSHGIDFVLKVGGQGCPVNVQQEFRSTGFPEKGKALPPNGTITGVYQSLYQVTDDGYRELNDVDSVELSGSGSFVYSISGESAMSATFGMNVSGIVNSQKYGKVGVLVEIRGNGEGEIGVSNRGIDIDEAGEGQMTELTRISFADFIAEVRVNQTTGLDREGKIREHRDYFLNDRVITKEEYRDFSIGVF
ncbi:MAG: hypothetical protein AB7P04_12155 [Bacteriovoracia bacterium]